MTSTSSVASGRTKGKPKGKGKPRSSALKAERVIGARLFFNRGRRRENHYDEFTENET